MPFKLSDLQKIVRYLEQEDIKEFEVLLTGTFCSPMGESGISVLFPFMRGGSIQMLRTEVEPAPKTRVTVIESRNI